MLRGISVSLTRILALLCLGLTLTSLTGSAPAQSTDDRRNEYRYTLVTTKPLTDKAVLFGYLGVVNSPDKNVQSLYFSPPGLIYKPKPWLEVWAGVFGIYNDNEEVNDTLEIRPLVGVKFYFPNTLKMNLFSFTRFEYRRILTQGSSSTNSIPRLRSRLGIEFPFRQATAWKTGSLYGLADIEPLYRFDDSYVEFYRVRGGVGYVFNRTWRAEFIYHAQFSGPAGSMKEFTDNIWRLNFKLNLPPRGGRGQEEGVPPTDDIDD